MIVEVTEADKARADDYCETTRHSPVALATLVAFVRHQAEEAMRERAASLVEQRLALISTLTDRAGSAVLACLPDAIRSIDTRGE